LFSVLTRDRNISLGDRYCERLARDSDIEAGADVVNGSVRRLDRKRSRGIVPDREEGIAGGKFEPVRIRMMGHEAGRGTKVDNDAVPQDDLPGLANACRVDGIRLQLRCKGHCGDQRCRYGASTDKPPAGSARQDAERRLLLFLLPLLEVFGRARRQQPLQRVLEQVLVRPREAVDRPVEPGAALDPGDQGRERDEHGEGQQGRGREAAVQVGRYDMAASEMLRSTWATQVGMRARRLADLMQQGSDSVTA
jgi:hypothetical protein